MIEGGRVEGEAGSGLEVSVTQLHIWLRSQFGIVQYLPFQKPLCRVEWGFTGASIHLASSSALVYNEQYLVVTPGSDDR